MRNGSIYAQQNQQQQQQHKFVTRRHIHGTAGKPQGYTSHILPHLLTADDMREMQLPKSSYREGSPSKYQSMKQYNTMQPTSTQNFDRTYSRDSARSHRSSIHSSRSHRSFGSQRSGASVNMMVLDEEHSKRIEDLEKVLEEERKGREKVQKELESLKTMFQGYIESSKKKP